MTDLPKISDETVYVFIRAACDAGAGAYISGGQGRLEVDDDQVRAGLAALVAYGWRPPHPVAAAPEVQSLEPVEPEGKQQHD